MTTPLLFNTKVSNLLLWFSLVTNVWNVSEWSLKIWGRDVEVGVHACVIAKLSSKSVNGLGREPEPRCCPMWHQSEEGSDIKSSKLSLQIPLKLTIGTVKSLSLGSAKPGMTGGQRRWSILSEWRKEEWGTINWTSRHWISTSDLNVQHLFFNGDGPRSILPPSRGHWSD